eukprot:scaffold36314_cov31-Tisochrysis_lutea.AAC.1
MSPPPSTFTEERCFDDDSRVSRDNSGEGAHSTDSSSVSVEAACTTPRKVNPEVPCSFDEVMDKSREKAAAALTRGSMSSMQAQRECSIASATSAGSPLRKSRFSHAAQKSSRARPTSSPAFTPTRVLPVAAAFASVATSIKTSAAAAFSAFRACRVSKITSRDSSDTHAHAAGGKLVTVVIPAEAPGMASAASLRERVISSSSNDTEVDRISAAGGMSKASSNQPGIGPSRRQPAGAAA